MGDGHNVWLWLYKAFIIIWITFGLGYLIMILGFIAKGMKSKKVRGVLEKRLHGIRNTKEKLSKDIDYMRRVVNELYLMKLKPVYDVQGNEITAESSRLPASGTAHLAHVRSRRPSCVHFERKSSSLPRLPVYSTELAQVHSDEQNSLSSGHLRRNLSESDLSRIDKEETFASFRDLVSPDELLETVVNALSGNVMQNVINAVDQLNKYEQQVEDEKNFGTEASPEESGDDQSRRGSCDSEDSNSSGASTTLDNLTPRITTPIGKVTCNYQFKLLICMLYYFIIFLQKILAQRRLGSWVPCRKVTRKSFWTILQQIPWNPWLSTSPRQGPPLPKP